MATVEWDPRAGALRLLDQTCLPGAEVYVSCRSAAEVASAIRRMAVRGAPAIGAAAAYGTAMAARDGELEAGAAELRAARPTARDLFAGVERVEQAHRRGGPGAALAEAHAITLETVERCRAIGRHGLQLIRPGARILTICNTGALATVDYGTAFGIIRAAHEAGLSVFAYAMETRPRAQGAKLTALELRQNGIPFKLVADSAIGLLLRRGMVDVALAGADRICANGDVVNKVGTYVLASLCRLHDVPFYVAAPSSTLDPATAEGDAVTIEERDPAEVTIFAPAGTDAWNPAFDVTPAELVTALVTEQGVRSGALV